MTLGSLAGAYYVRATPGSTLSFLNPVGMRESTGAHTAANLTTGTIPAARLPFTPVQQGGGAGQAANKIYIGWSGADLKAQVDGTDLGAIAFKSWASHAPNIQTGSLNRSVIPVASETERGGVLVATHSQTASSTADYLAITPPKLRFGFSALFETSGHITFPSWMLGFTIKWGRVTLNSGQSSAVTSFPGVALAGTAFHYSNAAGGGSAAMRCLPNGNSFIVVNTESSPRLVGWIAFGV